MSDKIWVDPETGIYVNTPFIMKTKIVAGTQIKQTRKYNTIPLSEWQNQQYQKNIALLTQHERDNGLI